jgi:hypothetical protein
MSRTVDDQRMLLCLLVAARIPLYELGPRNTSLEQVYLTHCREGGSQPIR